MMNNFSPRPNQAGFTLVEFLVALLIGMLIVLAAVASLFGTRATSLASDNVNELGQSSAHAFQVLRQQVAQAGYIPIDLVNGIRGYYNVNATKPTNVAAEPAFFAVKGTEAGGTGNDTLKLGYAPNSDYASDCLGQVGKPYKAGFPADPTNARLITSQFSVDSQGNLVCEGSGNPGSPQPLIEGVERFDVTYGIAAMPTDYQITRYVKADFLAGPADFMKVRAVRVCLQLVSRSGSTPKQTYIDCDGTSRTSSDGRLRGVYTSSFALRNNLGAL